MYGQETTDKEGFTISNSSNNGIKTGILVLPPLNPNSIPGIKQSAAGTAVISNYELVIPHRRLLFNDVKTFDDHLIYVSPSETPLDLNNKLSMYAAMLVEIAKRTQRLLIVAPGPKVPLIYALLASQLTDLPLTSVRLLIGNHLMTSAEVIDAINKADKNVLKQQWDIITSNDKNDDPVTPELDETTTQVVTPTAPVREYKQSELLTTPSGATLRPYQQQMVDFAMSKKRVGLFVDMGLGKTLASLATLDRLVKRHRLDPTRPVLVIAPITVALDTWSREAEKWGYDMDVKINIQLSPKKRKALLDDISKPQEKLTLVTTNPAQMKGILAYYDERRMIPPFQAVIVDELSQFKSPTAQRFKQLSRLTGHAEYFFGLTGTPSPNNLLDIWSQMISIDGNNRQRLGYTFFQYRQNFFIPDKIGRDGTVYSWKLKEGAEDRIYDLMRPTVISMRSEGLIDLPDIVYDNRYVKLPPKAQSLYDEMNIDLRRELNEQEKEPDKSKKKNVSLELDEGDVAIANNAVLTSKLAQLSSGALYDGVMDPDSMSGKYEVFHDVKFQALKEIIDNATSPVLVFFYFKSELERMREYFDYVYLNPHDPDFRGIVSRWNKGEIPVLVAHPASAGHGLNLQDGGHTMVWLTTTWSNEQYRQAVKRLYRSGQKHSVSVIHIVAKDTVDEEIIGRIDTKEAGQAKLMKALDVAQRPKRS